MSRISSINSVDDNEVNTFLVIDHISPSQSALLRSKHFPNFPKSVGDVDSFPVEPGMLNYRVVSNNFYFHPYLGKWSNLTTNIFQMGWFNHQLVKHVENSHPTKVVFHYWKTLGGGVDSIQQASSHFYHERFSLLKHTNSASSDFCWLAPYMW